LVLLSYFIFEATTGKRVHPAHYILAGVARSSFTCTSYPSAERIGFDYGFLLAGAATVILFSVNAAWIFSSRLQGEGPGYIYASEDNALLVGAIASFLAVAAAMYFTQRIEWYSSLPVTVTSEQTKP
jgi:inner membrane protein